VSRFLRRWGPALLWTAVLFAASSRPSLPVDLHSGTDKLAHFAAYAVLGVLLGRAQALSGIAVAWAILIGVMIGGLDELYQSTVPNRHADVGDWLADSAGVVTGVRLYHVWRRRHDRDRPGIRRTEPLTHE
jgi:VanZ family protein